MRVRKRLRGVTPLHKQRWSLVPMPPHLKAEIEKAIESMETMTTIVRKGVPPLGQFTKMTKKTKKTKS